MGERKLVAIMFTDIVGFSSLTSVDEAQTLKLMEEHGKLLRSVFPRYGGTVVKSTGDGYLVEFASAVEAVNCGVEVQKKTVGFNTGREVGKGLAIRIGIHVGDVIHSGGDVLGDAVNVAARLESIADPGGICLSRQVMDQVQRKVGYRMVSLGMRELKNIRYPVEVFRLDMSEGNPSSGRVAFDPRRVAVLPFANMSQDPNDKYFADGMTEEVISTVAKISELQIISRTSVMRYKEGTAQVSQIGQELGVGSVLEGSVRKSGNRVRITAQLIEVEGDKHIWSQSYDRDLTDVFAIQADIAEQVAGSLKVQLLSQEKQSIRTEATSNSEAYTLYLKGRYYWNERTKDGTLKALKYFEEAAKIDSRFAMAYSGIADAYNILSDYGWMPPSEALPLAKTNATKALEIDDSLAEAHASLGLSLSNLDWDLASAEREYEKAIEIKPNYAQAYHWYAVDLFYMRRYREAFAQIERALALDPLSRVYNMVRTNTLLFFNRYDEALETYAELIASYPDMSALRLWRSTCYILASRFDEAVDDARKYASMEGGSRTSMYSANLFLAYVLACAGRKVEAEELVNKAVQESQSTFVSPAAIGWVYLALGKKPEGYDWLEKAFSERDPSLLYFNGFPWMKEFRADPRWLDIESRLPFKSAAE